MKRSPGVTFAAVIALTGSILTLLFGLLMLVVMMFAPIPAAGQGPASPRFLRLMFLLGSLIYLLPSIWGIVTSICLFRLKNWARISIIVFSVLLMLTGLFAGLGSLLMPTMAGVNTTTNPSMMMGIRLGLGVFWLTQLGIGVWWLVFFTRANVKAQFASASMLTTALLPMPPMSGVAPPRSVTPVLTGPQRPLSITIIAWLLLVGCVFLLLNLLLKTPFVLGTRMITGWAAAAIYLGFVPINFFVGRGLLRLQPWARQMAIGLYGFGLLNAAVFYFAPGAHTRMLAFMESQESAFWWEKMLPNQPHVRMDLGPLLPFFAVLGLIGAAVPIYFLVTRKPAFEAKQQ